MTEDVNVSNEVVNQYQILQKGQTGLRLRTGHQISKGPMRTVSAAWGSRTWAALDWERMGGEQGK